MGLLSGSLSLAEYRVEGDIDKLRNEEWLANRLQLTAFRPIDDTAEEMAAGWTRLGEPRDNDFAARHDFLREDYLAFSLRIDRRRIPGALLKQQLQEASEAFLASRPGLRRVPKTKREELREQVKLSLLARTLPVPAVFDVLWHRQRRRLWLFSLNRQAVENFESLFGRTFEGMQLVPMAPIDRAAACVPEELQEALQALNPAAGQGYLERVEGNHWLGTDFLLWLFHNSLTRSGDYVVHRPGPALEGAGFVAYLNDRLLLAASTDEGSQKVTLAGPQTRFAEAKTALAQGKEIRESTLYLEREQHQWRFSLKGDRFHLGSLRCPVVKPEYDPAEHESLAEVAEFFARVGAVEEGMQLFESLLQAFLRERLAPAWEAQAQSIRDWLAEKG